MKSSIRMTTRLILVAFLIVFIVFIVTFLFPVLGARQRGRMTRFLARVSLWVLGIRIRCLGSVPDVGAAQTGWADSGVGYMVCSNHVSFVDIFALSAVIPVRFVAKREIASWPIFGMISRRTETIFIDRSRRRAVLEIADAMASAMKEGRNVLFFPEGTTGRGRGLLPFHANLFAAAIDARSPVLPVVLDYNEPEVVSYADRSLFEVMKAICGTSGLEVTIRVLSALESADRERRELCAETSRQMANALGVPDATAEQEKQRLQRMTRTTTS